MYITFLNRDPVQVANTKKVNENIRALFSNEKTPNLSPKDQRAVTEAFVKESLKKGETPTELLTKTNLINELRKNMPQANISTIIKLATEAMKLSQPTKPNGYGTFVYTGIEAAAKQIAAAYKDYPHDPKSEIIRTASIRLQNEEDAKIPASEKLDALISNIQTNKANALTDVYHSAGSSLVKQILELVDPKIQLKLLNKLGQKAQELLQNDENGIYRMNPRQKNKVLETLESVNQALQRFKKPEIELPQFPITKVKQSTETPPTWKTYKAFSQSYDKVKKQGLSPKIHFDALFKEAESKGIDTKKACQFYREKATFEKLAKQLLKTKTDPDITRDELDAFEQKQVQDAAIIRNVLLRKESPDKLQDVSEESLRTCLKSIDKLDLPATPNQISNLKEAITKILKGMGEYILIAP